MAQSRRGRPPISEFWVTLIQQQAVNFPHVSAAEIARQVAKQGEKIGKTDYPKDRRVREIVAAVRGAGEEVQRPHRYVRWPDSFDSGALPWEAAPAVLELLSPILAAESEPENRPTVEGALVWWHVAQSAPHLSFEARQKVARILLCRGRGWVDDDVLAQRDAERLMLGLPAVGRWEVEDLHVQPALFVWENTGVPGKRRETREAAEAMRAKLEAMNAEIDLRGAPVQQISWPGKKDND